MPRWKVFVNDMQFFFCKDYKGRRSGGPDFFYLEGGAATMHICVKGPGNTPQENQKRWFDALLRANAAVEICKVIDIATIDNNPTSVKGKKRKAKTPASSSSRRKEHAQVLDSASGSEEDDHMKREQERGLSNGTDSQLRPGKRRRLTKPEDMDHQHTPLSPSISGMKGHFDR